MKVIAKIKKGFRIRQLIREARDALNARNYDTAIEKAQTAIDLRHDEQAIKIRNEACVERFKRGIAEAKRDYKNYIEQGDTTSISSATEKVKSALELTHGVPEEEVSSAKDLQLSIKNAAADKAKFSQARKFFDSGQLDQCSELLRELAGFPSADVLRPKVEYRKKEAAKLYSRSSECLDDDRTARARQLFDQAVKMYADSPDRKNLEKTLEKQEKVDNLLRQARKDRQSGNLRSAYENFLEAQELSPRNATITTEFQEAKKRLVDKHIADGESAEKDGLLKKAISEYQTACEIKPDCSATDNLSVLQEIQGKIKTELDKAKASFRNDKLDSAHKHLKAAKEYGFHLGELERFESEFTQMIDELSDAGRNAFDGGKLEQAIKHWSKIPASLNSELKETLDQAKQKIDQADRLCVEAKSNFDARRFKDAKQKLDEALANYELHEDSRKLLKKVKSKLEVIELRNSAEGHYDDKKLDDAWDCIDEAYRKDRDDQDVSETYQKLQNLRKNLLGLCREADNAIADKDLSSAKMKLDQAKRYDFAFSEIDEVEARLAQKKKDVDKDLEEAENYIADKNFSAANRKIDDALRIDGSSDKAKRLRNEIEEIKRQAKRLLDSAKTELERGDFDDALDELNELDELYPGYTGITNLQKKIDHGLKEQKRQDEAQRLYEQALDESNPRAAQRKIKRALELFPDFDKAQSELPRIEKQVRALELFEQASTLHRQEDLSEAISLYEQSLELHYREKVQKELEQAKEKLRQQELEEKFQSALRAFDAKEFDSAKTLARQIESQYSKAGELLEKITEVESRADELVESAKAEDEPIKALSILKQALDVYPNYQPAIDIKPEFERQAKAWESMLVADELATSRNVEKLEDAIEKYKDALNLYDHEQIRTKLEKASSKLLELLPENAQQELDNRNWSKAESIAKEGMKRFPKKRSQFKSILDEVQQKTDLMRAKFAQAKGLYESHLIDECLDALRAVLELDPGNNEALKLQSKAIEWQKAGKSVEKGWNLFEDEKYEEALEIANSVLEKIPEHEDARELKDAIIEASAKPVGDVLSGTIKLYVEGGNVDFVLVPEFPFKIGSKGDNHLKITGSVSRYHAEVEHSGNEFMLKNISTSYPVKVNEKSISGRRRLNDGDVVQIGKNELLFSQRTGSSSATLKHTQGPRLQEDVLYALLNGSITVGNYHNGNATLGVLNDSVESEHLKISHKDDVYSVEPVAGMSVNERPETSTVEIREDMTIQIGKVNIRPVEVER